jgi:hypothetical protein
MYQFKMVTGSSSTAKVTAAKQQQTRDIYFTLSFVVTIRHRTPHKYGKWIDRWHGHNSFQRWIRLLVTKMAVIQPINDMRSHFTGIILTRY